MEPQKYMIKFGAIFKYVENINSYTFIGSLDGDTLENRLAQIEESQANRRKEIILQMDKKGYCEVDPGLYLSSKENMISDQKQWDQFDRQKNYDFSKKNFWSISDEGEVVQGYNSVEDYLDRP